MTTLTAELPIDLATALSPAVLGRWFSAAFLLSSSDTEVQLQTANANGQTHYVTISGTGLGGLDSHGVPTTGAVTDFLVETYWRDTALSLSGLSLDIADLRDAIAGGQLTAIEDLLFGGDDVMTGALDGSSNLLGNALDGRAGADTITGGQNIDYLVGGAGDDVISGGDENSNFSALTGDALDGGDGADTVSGGEGLDTLVGGSGADLLFQSGGVLSSEVAWRYLASPLNGFREVRTGVASSPYAEDGSADTLSGGAGDDRIWAGLGDSVDGGDGADWAEISFTARASGLKLDLSGDAAAAISTASGAAAINVELFAIRGSTYADKLTGSAGLDTLIGGASADQIDGGAGNDVLIASDYSLSETVGGVNGSRFDDQVADSVNGGLGDDIVTVGLFDSANGGAGTDKLDVTFAGLSHGLTLDLVHGNAWATLAAQTGGVLKGFETLNAVHATRYSDLIDAADVRRVYTYDGNDTVHGSAAAEVFGGGAGRDNLQGGSGDDVLFGGAGRDSITGDNGNDWIFGDADSTHGIEGPGADADSISGGAGFDQISAGGGDDTVSGGKDADQLDGGDGFDTVSYADARSAIGFYLSWIDYGTDPYSGRSIEIMKVSGEGSGDADGDRIDNFERYVGSAYDDVMQANGSWSGGAPTLTFDGGAGNDTLLGSFVTDHLYGGVGDDLLTANGSDDLNGGAGDDMVSFIDAFYDPVHVDLRIKGPQLTLSDVFSEDYDTLTSIEGVTGAFGDDVLHGNDKDNVLIGSGNDTGGDSLYGHGGDDLILGDGDGYGFISDPDYPDGPGDRLFGNEGDDTIRGGGGGDVVKGGIGNDAIYGEGGADSLDGEDGGDVIDGGLLNDTIDGGGGGDTLIGGDGVDVLIGGAGGDVLTGGRGSDRMSGGEGADRFVFTAANESPADMILDLENKDIVDVSAIDADPGLTGDQAFLRVTAFHGAAGEMVVAYNAAKDVTAFLFDIDGDGHSDMTIHAKGDHHTFAGFVL